MTFNHTPRVNYTPRARAARFAPTPIACLLVLAPLTSMAEEPKAETLSVVSASPGIVETSAGLYEFTPRSCFIHMEDGVPDIEIQGPGTAPDGEIFYFEFSSTANEMTVEFGVDEPYETTNRKLKAGQYVSNAFEVEVSGDIISVIGLDLVDEQGQSVDSNASLRIDCSK